VGCSILLVDDSRITRQVMRKTLRSLLSDDATQIDEADGGVQAIAAIRANQYDLVFLDLTMPETSGYDVLATLHGTTSSTRFVVMSADVQPKARERVMQLGATAFLRKPPNPEELKAFLAEQSLLKENTA
jgi:CheY-like chemotaxis protein